MNSLPKHLGKAIALLAMLAAIAMIVVACGGGPTPVPPTATAAPQPTKAPAQPTTAPTAVPAQPTAAPTAAATKAPAPTAAPTAGPTVAPQAAKVPEAVVSIVPVPGNAASKVAITTTIKMMTDTKVGPKNATVALYTSGLTNVPISVPVKVQATPADPKFTGNVKWALTAPQGSKAKLNATDKPQVQFTPDMVGAYMVTAVFSTSDGKTSGEMGAIQLHAGMFEGVTAGKCGTCHPDEATEWAKTGHAVIFSDEVDNKRTPDVATHYSESCIRCHNTGYYPGAANGGFADAQAKAKWAFPTFAQIDAAGKGGASNFAAMPAEVKNMANIQCEACHGPAKEHVEQGAKVMQATQDEGVCNQCHNGGGHHLKGTDLQNSKHSDATATAWTEPTGPDEQACVRCHSGNGYVSFLADPANQTSWDNTPQTVVCSTCHDPHSEANAFQLRIVSKPVGLPFEVTKDVGLSATCMECHNGRNKPADVAKGQTSFPHYSTAAEMVNDAAGVTYGQTLPNSPHGMMVGNAPIANPAAKDDPEAAKFLFSKAGDAKGNVPGACVACHMYPGIEDSKDPNYHKVGSHSFNMVSPDGKFDYTAGCQSCHGKDMKDFNLKAKADYDGNGKIEGDQDEVTGLLNVLWKALEGKGLKKIDTGYPYATLPKDASGATDPKISNAWYNFRVVYGVMWGQETGNGNQGKAAAIHNFKRSVALLQLSYKDLTGQDVPGATLIK